MRYTTRRLPYCALLRFSGFHELAVRKLVHTADGDASDLT